MAKLDIVIPCAGLGRRMKSYGPKALIPVGPETLIGRQIRLLTAAYPDSRVIVVAGYEADRIKKAVPGGTKVVVNRRYAETNVARSIQLGLAVSHPARSALVVYGDLVFNRRAIDAIPRGISSVIVEPGDARPGEVGVNVVDMKAVHLSYGLDPKWAHITMLAPHEKRLFLAACQAHHATDNLLGFEVLNMVLDRGGELHALTHEDLRLVEVDTSRDIDRVGALCDWAC